MNYYTGQHKYYCGIDLHAKTMYACIYDKEGDKVLHRNMRNQEDYLSKVIGQYQDIVVAVESTYNWYWIADACAKYGISFVLGHALYMKAIHGSKTKNDRIDSEKIALLLRAGLLPTGYVYPEKMRATRDLLRRRIYFVRKRAALHTHIQILNSQYNLGSIGKGARVKKERAVLAEHFEKRDVRKSVEVNLKLIEDHDAVIKELDKYLYTTAKTHDKEALEILQSIKGVGKTIALTVLYEVSDINRFPRVQDFLSYSRLVKCEKRSAGKRCGEGGKRMGNPYLKWAFSEASVFILRDNPGVAAYFAKLEKKRGEARARALLASKIGRAVYFMLKRRSKFDEEKFLNR